MWLADLADVDDLADLDAGSACAPRDICTRHADGVVLPRGWALRDRRAPAPARLRAVPDPEREPVAPPDDLAQVLDARTPLLRRAFRNVSDELA